VVDPSAFCTPEPGLSRGRYFANRQYRQKLNDLLVSFLESEAEGGTRMNALLARQTLALA